MTEGLWVTAMASVWLCFQSGLQALGRKTAVSLRNSASPCYPIVSKYRSTRRKSSLLILTISKDHQTATCVHRPFSPGQPVAQHPCPASPAHRFSSAVVAFGSSLAFHTASSIAGFSWGPGEGGYSWRPAVQACAVLVPEQMDHSQS